MKERPGRYRRRLERLGEAGFQEFSKFCCCLELRDWLQLLECRGKGIGEAPDRARPEFVVPRFEVQIVNPPGQLLRHFESALDERLVDDNFGRDIGEFAPLPRLHLLPHGLKVALHPVDADRNAIDQRERLRVFGEHRCEHACGNVAKVSTALTRDPLIPGPQGCFPCVAPQLQIARPRIARDPCVAPGD